MSITITIPPPCAADYDQDGAVWWHYDRLLGGDTNAVLVAMSRYRQRAAELLAEHAQEEVANLLEGHLDDYKVEVVYDTPAGFVTPAPDWPSEVIDVIQAWYNERFKDLLANCCREAR